MQRKLFAALSLASYLSTSVFAATPCEQIESAISSSSSVSYPGKTSLRYAHGHLTKFSTTGSSNYTLDIAHWSAAATLPALCSVEPGTAQDLGIIVSPLDSSFKLRV